MDLSGLTAPVENEDKNQLGLKDLFRKDILIITLVMFFNWPIITMGYFGLGLSMTELGGNIFVDFILGALVEVGINISCMTVTVCVLKIPGYLLCALLIDIWGRKPFFIR